MVEAVLSNSAQFGTNFVPAILDDDNRYEGSGKAGCHDEDIIDSFSSGPML